MKNLFGKLIRLIGSIARINHYKNDWKVKEDGQVHSNKTKRFLGFIPKWWVFEWKSDITKHADYAIVDPWNSEINWFPKGLPPKVKHKDHEVDHLVKFRAIGAFKAIWYYIYFHFKYTYKYNPFEISAKLNERDNNGKVVRTVIQLHTHNVVAFCKKCNGPIIIDPRSKPTAYFCEQCKTWYNI